MRYVIGALEQGLVGLLLVLAPVPFLFFASRHQAAGKVLVAVSPGLTIAALFIAACLASHWTTQSTFWTPWTVYQILLVLAALLVIPATLALRWKWLGTLHIATLVGAVYLWFIAGAALSRDWP